VTEEHDRIDDIDVLISTIIRHEKRLQECLERIDAIIKSLRCGNRAEQRDDSCSSVNGEKMGLFIDGNRKNRSLVSPLSEP